MPKRNYIYSIWTTMVTEECCVCGILFAMTSDFEKARRKDKKDFSCPNGHKQHYLGETKEDRLQRQVSNLKAAKLLC